MTATRDPLYGHVVGIDGCPGGWIAVSLQDGAASWTLAAVEDIAGLLPADGCAGIDMPIGLLDSGRRACDALARRGLLGAASRVFTTPPRPVLEFGPDAPNDAVQALSRALAGQGVSRQALHLAPHVLALDAALAALPAASVVEVHPELSFTAMAGRVLERKATAAGRDQRLAALRPWLAEVDALVARRPAGVPIVDALDALAALWSAVRWRDGRAWTLPADATQAPLIVV